MGLKDRMKHRPSQLSGGEAQRVAIARALANKPHMLLADEPTGNLDPITSESVFSVLVEIVRETGLSALIATHNPELADRRIVKSPCATAFEEMDTLGLSGRIAFNSVLFRVGHGERGSEDRAKRRISLYTWHHTDFLLEGAVKSKSGQLLRKIPDAAAAMRIPATCSVR